MNITLRNSGTPFNISFGGSISINRFYYNVAEDTIYAKQIIENSGLSQQMKVTSTGVVYLKGIKQTNASFSKKFELTKDGNLIAKAFVTEN